MEKKTLTLKTEEGSFNLREGNNLFTLSHDKLKGVSEADKLKYSDQDFANIYLVNTETVLLILKKSCVPQVIELRKEFGILKTKALVCHTCLIADDELFSVYPSVNRSKIILKSRKDSPLRRPTSAMRSNALSTPKKNITPINLSLDKSNKRKSYLSDNDEEEKRIEEVLPQKSSKKVRLSLPLPSQKSKPSKSKLNIDKSSPDLKLIAVTSCLKKVLNKIKREIHKLSNFKYTENIKKADILILGSKKVERTYKLLFALSKGLVVSTVEFLKNQNEECKSFIRDPQPYSIVVPKYVSKTTSELVVNKEITLALCMEKRPNSISFFEGKTILLTNNILPTFDDTMALLCNYGVPTKQIMTLSKELTEASFKGAVICLTCKKDITRPRVKKMLHALTLRNDVHILDIGWCTTGIVENNFTLEKTPYKIKLFCK